MADINIEGQSGQGGTGTQNTGDPKPAAVDNSGTQGLKTDQNTQGTGTKTNDTGTGQQTTGKKVFTYDEDRSKWVPSHRISEETQKRTAIETENKRLNDQLKALVGVTPVTPEAEKAGKVKDAMFEMFPWAKKLSELSNEQLDRVLNAADNVDAANQFITQNWSKHAKSTTKALIEEVTAMSGELSDRAKGRLETAFKTMIEDEITKAERTGNVSDSLQKYIDGDESLVVDYAKEWNEDFVKPARRQVVTQEIDRSKRVPNSTGRSQVTSIQKPASFKSLDERLDYAANLAKERGVQFGQ
jgi:hypothetical protein